MSATFHRMVRNPEVTRCEISVDDCLVPYIDVYELPDGTLSVSLTRPGHSPLMALDVESDEEILRWAPLLANAMAVAAGRTSHGPNSRPHNPHGANWFFDDHSVTEMSESMDRARVLAFTHDLDGELGGSLV